MWGDEVYYPFMVCCGIFGSAYQHLGDSKVGRNDWGWHFASFFFDLREPRLLQMDEDNQQVLQEGLQIIIILVLGATLESGVC